MILDVHCDQTVIGAVAPWVENTCFLTVRGALMFFRRQVRLSSLPEKGVKA